MGNIILFAAAGSAGAASSGNTTMLAIGLLIAATAIWLGASSLVRILRARKTHAATGGRFEEYVLQALVGAARIDGRVTEPERAAIAQALGDAAAPADPAALDAAYAAPQLSKDELVAYLAERSGQFTHAQKVALLKALLAVFVADGHFDEAEHGALIDYTAAVGFDRASAPQMLRNAAADLKRGRII